MAPTKRCNCGHDIHAAFRTCPHCGFEFSRKVYTQKEETNMKTDYRNALEVEADTIREMLPAGIELIGVYPLPNTPPGSSDRFYVIRHNNVILNRPTAKAVMHDAWGFAHGKKGLLKT